MTEHSERRPGEELPRLIAERGLTASQLARGADVSRSLVSRPPRMQAIVDWT